MDYKIINVKEYKNSIKKQCGQVCGRPATVTAVRVSKNSRGSLRMPLRYCVEHAIQAGVIQPKVDGDVLADTELEQLDTFGPAMEVN